MISSRRLKENNKFTSFNTKGRIQYIMLYIEFTGKIEVAKKTWMYERKLSCDHKGAEGFTLEVILNLFRKSHILLMVFYFKCIC